MKNTYHALAVCCLCCVLMSVLCGAMNVFAQDVTPTPEPTKSPSTEIAPAMDELRVPNSPVFMLLGSAAEINKPATPKAFMLNVLKSSTETTSTFPQNIAIEFAPYWWVSHPELTFEDYYAKTGFGQSIVQTFSISIGTAALPSEDPKVQGTRAGVGFRFHLLSGKVNPQLKKKVQELTEKSQELTKKVQEPVEKERSLTEKVQELKELQLDLLNQILMDEEPTEVAAKLSLVEAVLKQKAAEIQELNKERDGLQVEVASAALMDFPQNSWDDADFTRFGAWLTASYHAFNEAGESSPLTVLAIGRYIYAGEANEKTKEVDEKEAMFDAGVGLVWRFKDVPISVSAEYVHRFTDQADDRVVGILEYKIDETYSVFASYGKAFKEGDEKAKNLVAMFGLNFGWGKWPVIQ